MNIEHLKDLAELAALNFTDEELKDYIDDLNKILEYVGVLKNLNLENYSESNMLTYNELRKDKKIEKDDIALNFKNAPKVELDYFSVPKTLIK